MTVADALRSIGRTDLAETERWIRRQAMAAMREDRRCADCGAADATVLVETVCGDWLCRRCWAATTGTPEVYQPATPTLDRAIAEADRAAAEAEQDGR